MFTSFFHPTTFFPELLNFPLLAPFLLRISVALFLAFICYDRFKKGQNQWLGALSIVFGILIFIGLQTQISAILGILTLKANYWLNKKEFDFEKILLLGFSCMILLSLLFSGPGLFALDLPL